MSVILTSPGATQCLTDATALRFDAPDGARGVWPGHEPALCELEAGAVTITSRAGEPEPQIHRIATEGGLVWIGPRETRLVTPWFAVAATPAALVALVEAREGFRQDVEARARALAQRHELALRRAFAGLRRSPT